MAMDQPYIAPANGGMLGQFAALANAGLQAWDQNRRYQFDRTLTEQNQQAGLLSKGLVVDSDQNSPTFNKVKRDPVSDAAYQQQVQESQAGSDASRQQVRVAKAALQKISPEIASALDEEKMSGLQAKMYLDRFKPEIQGMAQIQARRPMQDLARGNQAARAADTFDKDHILNQLTTQQQQIRRDQHTLETAQILTPQIFNEINLGIANAISGGKAAAVTTQGKVEYDSLSLDLTRLQQKISNNPQDIGSPEVRQYTADILKRLDDAYAHNMQERANQLMQGRSAAYTQNPAAQKVLSDKAQSYGKGLVPPGLVSQPPQEAGPHGATVYQNGHMFKWNPQTKVYE